MKLASLIFALSAVAAQADTLDDATFQRLAQDAFAAPIDEFRIPGIAIALTIGGEHHIFTHGLADRDGAVPVTADTLFELGSVSKLFNVALAAVAEQNGLVSLSDPVSKWQPALEGSAFDAITLYDLAAHANGGLPLQIPEEITDMDGLMAYLADWNPSDPQSVRAYSNASIGLLGVISGKRFGNGFPNAVQDRVFAPLGLNDTLIDVPQGAMYRYAFGYSRDDDRAIRVTPGMLDDEAYGVKSTAPDMLRFLDAHLGQLKLDPSMTAALARTREAAYDTAHFSQAMIWEEYPWPVDPAEVEAGNDGAVMIMKPQSMTPRAAPLDGAMFLNKTGSTNGFGAYVAMVPSEEIGVVVLANRNYPNGVRSAATLELIDAVLNELRH